MEKTKKLLSLIFFIIKKGTKKNSDLYLNVSCNLLVHACCMNCSPKKKKFNQYGIQTYH